MLRARFTILVASVLAITGCDRSAQSDGDRSAPLDTATVSTIYIVVHHEDDEVHIDFEGNAMMKESSRFQANPESKDRTFRFVAMQLPPGESFMVGGTNDDPKNHVIEFTGNITRPEDNTLQLHGDLVTKTPVIIQFVMMTPKGQNEKDGFFELSFGPGHHTVKFDGTITGWWMPDIAADNTRE